MGSTSSTPVAVGEYSTNDYELVIKASKALEAQLQREFHSQGKGLHEHINSIAAQQHQQQPQGGGGLPETLVRKLRYIATIRNKLIHEADFHQVPDRTVFIKLLQESTEGLTTIARQRRAAAAAAAAARGGNAAAGETSNCSVM
jgi:hypothetical protein